MSYSAERLDWKSSQVFFQHGHLERNPQFTVTGLPNDFPLGYGAGNQQVLGNALRDLGASAINNTTTRVVERMLMERYPGRRTLIRTIGWIERISFAVALATVQSSEHFRQWRENERLDARDLLRLALPGQEELRTLARNDDDLIALRDEIPALAVGT